jgi:hypothetical protein
MGGLPALPDPQNYLRNIQLNAEIHIACTLLANNL